MNENQLIFVIEIINIFNYLTLGLLIISGLLLLLFKSIQYSNIYRIFFLYFLLNVVLKLTSKIYFYYNSNQGITEFPYFSLVYNILNFIFFHYFICYKLKISNKLLPYVNSISILVYSLFFYEIYESAFTSLYTQISYSQAVSKMVVCLMLLSYLINTINNKSRKEHPFFVLALIFLAYNTIEIVYSSASNYIINHVLSNDYVLLFMLSNVVIEFVYVLCLCFFVFSSVVLVNNKKQA